MYAYAPLTTNTILHHFLAQPCNTPATIPPQAGRKDSPTKYTATLQQKVLGAFAAGEGEAQVLLAGCPCLGVSDVTIRRHPCQHRCLALVGQGKVAVGIVRGGRLHQPCQQGGLGDIKLGGDNMKVMHGRRVDAIGPITKIDQIQIHREDRGFRIALLDFHR